MKKKDERLADYRLEKMGVAPNIYHFRGDISKPFTAITIVHSTLSKRRIRFILDFIQGDLNSDRECGFNPASHALEILHKNHVHGVAICDKHDTFNRQRGRTIAKGRLWKHLKQEGERN